MDSVTAATIAGVCEGVIDAIAGAAGAAKPEGRAHRRKAGGDDTSSAASSAPSSDDDDEPGSAARRCNATGPKRAPTAARPEMRRVERARQSQPVLRDGRASKAARPRSALSGPVKAITAMSRDQVKCREQGRRKPEVERTLQTLPVLRKCQTSAENRETTR